MSECCASGSCEVCDPLYRGGEYSFPADIPRKMHIRMGSVDDMLKEGLPVDDVMDEDE